MKGSSFRMRTITSVGIEILKLEFRLENEIMTVEKQQELKAELDGLKERLDYIAD